jgi:hypothetical protein
MERETDDDTHPDSIIVRIMKMNTALGFDPVTFGSIT